MKKLNVFVIMALMLTVITTSCSSDDDNIDNERPTIEILEPHDHDEYEPGGELHVNAILKDNVALSQYKIDIHYSGDGHTHRSEAKDEDHDHSVEWDHEIIESISGREHTIDIIIQIPEEIMHDGKMHKIKEGKYHFGIFVIDAAGNDVEAFMDIEIEDHHHDDGHGHGHDHD